MIPYKGYEIHIPTSGGKAGKGFNKTSSLQVRKNSCIVKTFRFQTACTSCSTGAADAVRRAKAWVDWRLSKPEEKQP